MLKKSFFLAMLFISLTSFVNATIVEFQTSQGNIQVNLFDKTTPKTVANFLQYIDEQHYTNSVVHRVSPNFVVQGGGFTFEGEWPLTRIATNSAVANEPVYSNVKGTIAMAKLSGSANSATDQWFFNLTNNASNLDLQNSGFTVFGQVIGDGMAVVEKIAGLALCQDIPMIEYSTQNCSDKSKPGIENFVVISQIMIIDSSEVTDADLAPERNKLVDSDNDGVLDVNDAFPYDPYEAVDTDLDGIGNNADSDDDNDGVLDVNDAFPLDSSKSKPSSSNNNSGGSFAWLSLLLIGLLTLRKRVFR